MKMILHRNSSNVQPKHNLERNLFPHDRDKLQHRQQPHLRAHFSPPTPPFPHLNHLALPPSLNPPGLGLRCPRAGAGLGCPGLGANRTTQTEGWSVASSETSQQKRRDLVGRTRVFNVGRHVA